MVNFDEVAIAITPLLSGIRSDEVLVRARPDPARVDLGDGQLEVVLVPTDDSFQAVITYGQYAIRPAASASADFRYQALDYQLYFDVWCKSYTGATGLDQIIPALHRALQAQTVAGLGVLRFLDAAYERNAPRAICLYSATVMSQV